MNRTPKEKQTRIELRVSRKEKDRLQQKARRCGLSLSEYLLKRAGGYEPKAAPTDDFYPFYEKLCELSNRPWTWDTEDRLLGLIDEVRRELILPERERDAVWQRPASGP